MFAKGVTLGGLQQMKANWGVSMRALIMRGAKFGHDRRQEKEFAFQATVVPGMAQERAGRRAPGGASPRVEITYP